VYFARPRHDFQRCKQKKVQEKEREKTSIDSILELLECTSDALGELEAQLAALVAPVEVELECGGDGLLETVGQRDFGCESVREHVDHMASSGGVVGCHSGVTTAQPIVQPKNSKLVNLSERTVR
jgi:hypothetical protein